MTTQESSPLSDLSGAATRLRDQSADLIARAADACATAWRLEAASRVHREERRQWQQIMARIPADPNHILVLCAYCRRAHGALGWTVLPLGIEDELKRWVGVRVSHGYCPECINRQRFD